MEVRKVPGRLPKAIRPFLPQLVQGLREAGVGTTDAVDGIANAFNVTRSTVWKATNLRSRDDKQGEVQG